MSDSEQIESRSCARPGDRSRDCVVLLDRRIEVTPPDTAINLRRILKDYLYFILRSQAITGMATGWMSWLRFLAIKSRATSRVSRGQCFCLQLTLLVAREDLSSVHMRASSRRRTSLPDVVSISIPIQPNWVGCLKQCGQRFHLRFISQ